MAGPCWGAGAGAGGEAVATGGAGACTSAEIRLFTWPKPFRMDRASAEDRRPSPSSRCTSACSLAAAARVPLGLLAVAAARIALTSPRRVAESWAASGAPAEEPPHPAITTPAARVHARAVLIWRKVYPGAMPVKATPMDR